LAARAAQVGEPVRRATLAELFITGTLIRVAATVLDACHRRRDIPYAADVARRVWLLQRASEEAACQLAGQQSAGAVAFAKLCQRLGDLLCGVLGRALGTYQYATEPARARDFAETFGSHPSLMWIPIRSAVRAFPTVLLPHQNELISLIIALAHCLPDGMPPGDLALPSQEAGSEPADPATHPPAACGGQPQSIDPKPLYLPSIRLADLLRRIMRDRPN